MSGGGRRRPTLSHGCSFRRSAVQTIRAVDRRQGRRKTPTGIHEELAMTVERRPWGRQKWSWLFVLVLAILSGAASAVILTQKDQHQITDSGASAKSRLDLFAPTTVSYLRPASYDDGGFGVFQSYILPIKDPRSLESIRDSYLGAG